MPDGYYWLETGIEDIEVAVVDGKMFCIRISDNEVICLGAADPGRLSLRNVLTPGPCCQGL